MHGVDSPATLAGLTAREVRNGVRGGEPTKVVVARREYRAPQDDVWDAITNAERLPRWFLPVTGSLVEGGRYQLEGNAGGVVESCDAPRSFAVTWEFGGGMSWVTVRLEPTASGTALQLEHEAAVPKEFWEQYGPGATGVGWDLGFVGLGLHLEGGGVALDPREFEGWTISGPGRVFVRAASNDWADAAIGAGDEPDAARAAADGTFAFYTGTPEAGAPGE